MDITIGNQTFDDTTLKQMAQTLNKNCDRVKAHGYNKFLEQTELNGIPLIEVIKALSDEAKTNKYVDSRSLGLSKTQQFDLVTEFFTGLNSELGELIKSILDKKNKSYKLKIDNKTHSHAGHSNEDTFIHIFVNLNDSLDNFHQLPHELSHAISGYNSHILKLVEEITLAKKSKDKQAINQKRDAFHAYTKSLGAFDKDCIGEIESHITERLFYRFLLKKKIITEDDYQNYRIGAMNSFSANVFQVLEEFKIIKNLSCPITYESAMAYIQKLLSSNSNKKFDLLNRMKVMSSPMVEGECTPVNAEYAMRYIFGEIISSEWFNLYEQSSKEECTLMKQRFVEYLSKNGDFKLNDASEFLLNKPIEQVVEDFLNNLKTKNQAVNP